MEEKRLDRRTMRTRKAVFEALAELMTQKELRHITVQELADKADIHRVTLYKHFMDIYDAYDQLEKMIMSELGIMITEYGVNPTFEVYGVVCDYIRKNPTYFKMIFSPHSPTALYWKVQNLVEGLNRMLWSESFDVAMNDSRIDSVIRYHSNGTLAVIGGWVTSDFAEPQAFVVDILKGLDRSTQAYMKALLKG